MNIAAGHPASFMPPVYKSHAPSLRRTPSLLNGRGTSHEPERQGWAHGAFFKPANSDPSLLLHVFTAFIAFIAFMAAMMTSLGQLRGCEYFRTAPGQSSSGD